ncbi:RNA recognition motif-containing protein [Diplocarpon rosae]|nr:RNA recognition motif-containing protein [Diplocarpon rosae]
MAARTGEDLAATLFADVHYYFTPPGAKPPHHRFEGGSYVYLFENASQRRARLEVANNAGTAEQDAFTGYLDAAHVRYSYKHSTLVTLTVKGPPGQRNSPTEGQEWHLPAFDPRNENKYMYPLHTLDLYFWTREDAVLFVNSIRRVLPPHQVTVQDAPIAPPPHAEEMSPVVQRLESVAVTDVGYQQGQTRDSRTTAPGAPASQEAPSFAPMAYNPAAPAAPEVIRHREKTPPPDDGAVNPLMAAAASDQAPTLAAPYQQHAFPGPPPQPPQQQSYFANVPPPGSAPPSQTHSAPVPAVPISPFAQHFPTSFAPPPTASSPYAQPPPASVTATPPAYQQQPQQPQQPQHQQHQQQPQPSHPPVPQFATHPGSPGLPTPGIYSPGLGTPMTGPPAPQPHVAPPGGFSQHQYGSASTTTPLMTDYSIHQQVYRPTEDEAYKPAKEVKAPRGNLEKRAGQLEKGVGSLFKKLEKKLG